MEYTFDVTMEPDTMRRFLLRHSYGILGLLISLAALVYLVVRWNGLAGQERILIGALASVFTVVNPLLLCLRAGKQVKNNPYYEKPITYKMAEEGIITSQGEEQVITPWKDIRRVVVMRKAAAVYTSSIHAFLFPFASMGDQKDEIIAYIKEHTA